MNLYQFNVYRANEGPNQRGSLALLGLVTVFAKTREDATTKAKSMIRREEVLGPLKRYLPIPLEGVAYLE